MNRTQTVAAQPHFFRIVYSSFVKGRLFRGPRAELVVEADTLEIAMREVKAANRAEGRIWHKEPATTTFFKIEETDEQAFHQNSQDLMMAAQDGTSNTGASNTRTAVEYEKRVAALRQKRRLASLRITPKA